MTESRQWQRVVSKNNGNCKQCKVSYRKGEEICWHAEYGAVCLSCGSGGDPELEWIAMNSTCQGNCKVCKRPYKMGDIIWWHEKEGAKCVPCAQGKDPAVRNLSETDKKEIHELKDEILRISGLGKPWLDEDRRQYKNLSARLSTRYGHVRSVKQFLDNLPRVD
jgi:hypothetical protein